MLLISTFLKGVLIGVPTSMGYPSGRVTLQSVNLAAEEINAKGGVVVKGAKRPPYNRSHHASEELDQQQLFRQDEYRVQRLYRDAKTLEMWDGTNETEKLLKAEALL
jgi:hypothetical protein